MLEIVIIPGATAPAANAVHVGEDVKAEVNVIV
jgi:hypothetical protein